MASVKMSEAITHRTLYLDGDEIALITIQKPGTGDCPQRAMIELKSKPTPVEVCMADLEAFEELARPRMTVIDCGRAE